MKCSRCTYLCSNSTGYEFCLQKRWAGKEPGGEDAYKYLNCEYFEHGPNCREYRPELSIQDLYEDWI